MLRHAVIISRVVRYYFKRAVCVYVLWKNAKHAKARGAQHLERASLTQRRLLRRNFTGMLVCTLLELVEAVYNTLRPVLNIRGVTISKYHGTIIPW